MSEKYLYPKVLAYGELTNDNPEMTIVRESTTILPAEVYVQYLRVDNISLSVYQAAKGGGGKLRFFDQATTQSSLWEIDVNGVKDINLPFGEEGVPWPFERDIKAILHGAGVEQARVWLSVEGHIDTNSGIITT